MAICSKCNNQISDDAKFCTSCGAVVEAKPEPIVAPAVQEKPVVENEVVTEAVPEETPVEENKPNEVVEEKKEEKEPVMAAAPVVPVVAAPVQKPAQTYAQASQYTPVAPPVQQPVQPNQYVQRQQAQPQYAQPQYAQPQYVPPVYQNQEIEPPQGSKYAPIGTGKWFGLTLLLAIPVVNIITLIVILCSKNVSLKNYAKSILIWVAISLVFSIIFTALGFTVLRPAIDELVDEFSGYVEDIGEYSQNYSGSYINDYGEIVMNG